MIVYWQKGVNPKLVNQYAFLPDIMATFIELAGAKYPNQYKGNKIYPLQGKSLVPVLKGKDEPIHTEPIFWEHEGNKAVRLGDYKLVMAYDAKNPDKWELYDMQKDRTEMHNLANKFPEKVKEMRNMWEQWAKRSMVEPWAKVVELERKKANR